MFSDDPATRRTAYGLLTFWVTVAFVSQIVGPALWMTWVLLPTGLGTAYWWSTRIWKWG